MPPPRRDEIVSQFLADVRHVDLDEVRQAVIVLAIQVLVDHCAGHEPPAMPGQELDQRVLLGCQFDLDAVAGHGP